MKGAVRKACKEDFEIGNTFVPAGTRVPSEVKSGLI